MTTGGGPDVSPQNSARRRLGPGGHDRRNVAGVVLSGGRSSRMGAEKAFVALAGRPLVAHVLDRLRPQVARVYLNAREGADRFRGLGCPVVVDAPGQRGAGPLAGIAAALAFAKAEGFAWLSTAPCDSPFLPLDLVARLMAPIVAGGARAAVAVSSFGLEPMFALWPIDAIAQIEAALAAGRASPRGVLAEIGAAKAEFEAQAGPDPFANLNTPADLAAAETALAGARRHATHRL